MCPGIEECPEAAAIELEEKLTLVSKLTRSGRMTVGELENYPHIEHLLSYNGEGACTMRSAKVITVTPDSSKELKERVYRLRYQIYVEELGHKLEND